MTNRKKNEKKMYITADYKSHSYFFLMHIIIYLCACTVELFITNWKQRTNEQTNKKKNRNHKHQEQSEREREKMKKRYMFYVLYV